MDSVCAVESLLDETVGLPDPIYLGLEVLSSMRCFNMPTHCNSDLSTTCDQDQDNPEVF